jgi:hypothetical protein
LAVSTIIVSGANPADFVVGGIALPATVTAGSSTTFTLTFTPGATGLRTATVTVNNDDCDEAVYDFAVQGTGSTPCPGDVTAPTFTCPTNITQNQTAGVCGAYINFPEPIPTDNCAMVHQNSGDNSLHFEDFNFITTPNLPFLNNATQMTFETWAKAPWDAQEQIISTNVNGLNIITENSKIVVNINNFAAAVRTICNPLIANTAYHIAVVYDGTQVIDQEKIKIYINGNLFPWEYTSGTTVPTQLDDYGVATTRIGWSSNACCYFDNGWFDETRFWSVARSRSAILADMNNELVGNEANLELYYDYNQGVTDGNNVGITPALDKTTNTYHGTLTGFGLTGTTGNFVSEKVERGSVQFSGTGVEGPCGLYPIGTTTITVSTQDLIGNPASCTYDVTINDTEAPVADLATLPDVNANCSGSMPTAPTATDCTTGSVNGTTATVFPVTSNTTITWTYDDGLGHTSTQNQNIVINSSPGDIIRDQALDFDGVDDIVIIGDVGALDGISQFTYEGWIKMNTFNNFVRIFGNSELNGFNTIGTAISLGNTSGDLNLVTRNGANSAGTTGNVFALNTWTHVAMVFNGTQIGNANRLKCYINGVEVPLTFSAAAIPATLISNNEPLVLGSNFAGLEFPGEMDEVVFWNVARTADEIRENMHLTLSGCETGLVAYYQMNDGSGSGTLTDKSSNGNDGTLTNMDNVNDWIVSGVNVGNDVATNSNSQTITVPIGASTQSFASVNLEMKLFAHSGAEDITVTYQEFTPNAITGVDAFSIIQNPMWTVNKSTSTENQLVDYTFTFPGGTFTSLDPTKYSLYWREMYADGAWTKIATPNVLTATTAAFGKISLTGQFMVAQESDTLVSDVRGNMYEFTNSNGRIFIPNTTKTSAASLGLPTTAITVEAWVKPAGVGSYNDIVTFVQDNGSTEHGFELGYGGGLWARVAGNAAGLATTPTVPITLNEWHHVAFTYDGAMIRLYLDGDEVSTLAETGDISYIDSWLVIGGYKDDNENYFHRGPIDEVRIWSTARSISELRENMHLTLKGNETGLVSYYQFNNDDVAGTVDGVKDATGLNHGMTDNMTTPHYMESEVAVAGGTSDRVTIPIAGTNINFPNTGIDIEFGATTPDGEIVVYRLETEKPHGWGNISGDVDNEYFVVRNFGNNSTFTALVDITFNRLSYISAADVGIAQASSPLQLYKRASNAYDAWGTTWGGADNATAGSNGSVGYNATNGITSFSQIVNVNTNNNSDLPVELLNFDAKRLNADKVDLDWATASELNNQGFEIERMLEVEGIFEAIGFVDGQGTTVNQTNYELLDDNSYTGVSYYRLKQVDFDGTTSYSEIKAVAGTGDKNTTYIDVSVYPNPVYKELKVRFNELPEGVKSANVQIMSINGQILHQFNAGLQSYQVLEIEYVEQLTPAMYILSIEMDNGEKVLQKFVKK